MRHTKRKLFARSKLPRQMRLSSDGRVLAARIAAGKRTRGEYEEARFIRAYFRNTGFTPDTLRAMRSLNGVGRPPLWRDE